MVWKPGTITLASAQIIFAGANIESVEINDRRVGYKAVFQGEPMEDTALTTLCQRLWALANSLPAPVAQSPV